MGVFMPLGDTITLEVTSTSDTADIPARPSIVRIYNGGEDIAFIAFADEASDTTGMPIPPGDVEVFEKGGSTMLSAVCGTSTTLYITPGEGQ
jgi:hypothetical protein